MKFSRYIESVGRNTVTPITKKEGLVGRLFIHEDKWLKLFDDYRIFEINWYAGGLAQSIDLYAIDQDDEVIDIVNILKA
jgi:hypothetical protein